MIVSMTVVENTVSEIVVCVPVDVENLPILLHSLVVGCLYL